MRLCLTSGQLPCPVRALWPKARGPGTAGQPWGCSSAPTRLASGHALPAMPTCQAARSWHHVSPWPSLPTANWTVPFPPPALQGVTPAQPRGWGSPGCPQPRNHKHFVTSSAASGRPHLPHTEQRRCLRHENGFHLCPAVVGTNPSSLSPAPRCRGLDHVYRVHTTTGTPQCHWGVGTHPTQGAAHPVPHYWHPPVPLRGGYPSYPRCCPPCAPPLCPKGGNGEPLDPVCPSDCPQQGIWACIFTPGPLPVLWARHGG